MRSWVLILSSCLASAPGCASEERIHALLRTMADGGSVPSDKVFYEAVNDDYIRRLSQDDVKDLLLLARKLLQDSRSEVRKYALLCFLAVTLRFSDGQPLLEPYVPDIARMADDHTSPLRPMALFVLSNTWPKRSPLALTYIRAHLTDKDNTPEEAGAMACTLLMEQSDPLTHEVIVFVRKQNNREMKNKVLECLHVYPTKNVAALEFIGASLDSPDEWIRRRAVEAVERVPLAERSRFLAQLNRLATDAKESPEIRSLAAEALKR